MIERYEENYSGSPACAGIDPRRQAIGSLSWRLPRVRGDRPPLVTAPLRNPRAPPRARGSTLYPSASSFSVYGSPACAGIDRRDHKAGREPGGLPRVRGDRPDQNMVFWRRTRAPPRARGSTFREMVRLFPVPGSPACAGIDLDRTVVTLGYSWLPRVRGDRPIPRGSRRHSFLAPPRARGSTVKEIPGLKQPDGSPACAGIDRDDSIVITGYDRLPRVRGDRPIYTLQDRDIVSAPPRARGSTCGRGGFS